MGHGNAQVAAAAGYVVIMSDPSPDALARGVQAIERNLAKAIQLKKISEQDRDDVLHRISCASRLEDTLGLEAMRMVEQGVASARDIDTAMELGYNHPMGPLRLTDLVGLDVRLHIAEYLHGKLGSDVFRPPEILRRMVSEGKLGKVFTAGMSRKRVKEHILLNGSGKPSGVQPLRLWLQQAKAEL
jgi:3-hydroxyacyl-CoA dehydrogenase